jgi:glutathione S-transferase
VTTPPLTLCEIGETGIAGLDSFSPFCVKVHRGLRALGLQYERRHGKQPSDFKSINPTGQVPVLLVGDRAVADSSVILREAEALAGGRSLRGGPGPRERAEASLWEELADSSLYGFVLSARWADDTNWPRTRDALLAAVPGAMRGLVGGMVRRRIIANVIARDVWRAGPDACWTRFRTLLDDLDARAPAAGPWVGDTLSVADVALFAQLHSLRNPITPQQASWIAERKALSAYLDRIGNETAGASR